MRMPLAPRLAGGLDRLAHGAAERDAALELLGHGLGDELGVEFGALDLDDLHADTGPLAIFSSFLRRVSISAPFLPITTPGRAVVTMTLILSPARSISTLETAARAEVLVQELPDSQVVCQVLGVVLVGVPTAAPLFGDAEAEPGGVDLLTHRRLCLLSRSDDDGDVAGALADARRGTLSAGTDALQAWGPRRRRRSSRPASPDAQVIAGTRRWPQRSSASSRQSRRLPRLVNIEGSREPAGTDLPRIWSTTMRALRGDTRTVAC